MRHRRSEDPARVAFFAGRFIGNSAEPPAELLGSQRMRVILERLAADADLVIVDSPPLQAVTDAAILSSITDGTLFVVDAGRTRRGAVRSGREALAKADARTLGVALNRLPERSTAGYYYAARAGDLQCTAGAACASPQRNVDHETVAV